MLSEIIRRVGNKGVLSVKEIATDLNVTASMAEEMCLELMRQGYLQAISGECGFTCGTCGAKDACSFMRAPRVWMLTEKGARTQS